MTTTNTTIAKIATIIAGLGLASMSFAVMPAHAQTASTTAQLQAQIQALLAQIQALQAQLGTAGSGASATYTRDLTIGSRGTDVTALQTWLISKGFSIPAGATGYFGSQTRAAVAAFQAANGISPTAGYFGPITRARVIAIIGSAGGGTSGGGTTTSPLQGSGRLTNIDELGDVESILDEGDSNQKVVGVSADAKDGDVALQRLDVEFDLSGTSGSNRLDRYVDSVSVWLGNKKLATMDASDADKNGSRWTMRFNDLNNGIIREGDTGNIYVAVDAVNNIDSNDAGNDIDVTIPRDGLRAVGAEGISETYVSRNITNTFSVDEASTGDLTLTESSDNPNDSLVQVDPDTTTDDVMLMSFNARARHQDVTINDLPVSFSVTGTSNVADVIQSVRLERGGRVLDTATVSGTGSSTTVVFNNLRETIDSGDTETYDVIANIRRVTSGTSGTAFTEGDTLTASTSANASWDAEDANGDQADISGTVTGGTVTFGTTGIQVSKSDATATKSVGTTVGSGDVTQYAIAFKVTAGDDDLYIDRSTQQTDSPSSAGAGIAWATTTSSTATSYKSSSATLSSASTNNGDTSTSYKVPAGTTRTFTLNVVIESNQTGFIGVRLTGINYDTDSNTNDSSTYYTTGLDTFKTQDVSMTTH